MKPKKLLLILCAFILSMLAACGSKTGGSEEKESVSKATTKNLIVYTNSASEGRGNWLKEKAAEKGFDIKIVEGGGGDIANRLEAEKNNSLADVVYGLTQMNFERLKSEKILVQYRPKWADEILEEFNDKEAYFHPIVEQAKFMIYNSDVYKPEEAPKDFMDLWTKKEFKGKYHVPNNLKGNSDSAIVAGILVRYLDPKGELGVSAEGWKVIKEYFANGYKTPEGEENFANLASGKVPISHIFASGLVGKAKAFNHKPGIVSASIGVPTTVEQVGIIKGSKNVEVAKEFVEWFGSAEVQGEWAKKFGSVPINEKALDQALPEMKEVAKNTVPQNIDWKIVNKYMNDWIEKIELEIL
ncbi:extracellular solute-binding protein [Bacillus cereus]|uniref:extracellular solute-binding protein n=1 Tax=Bacillus cereus TaxID=1396 RepID=UPI0027D31ED6|nr:extracellular solute-binding protein [Bacillus cereus]MCU5603826.1 extracellular solute-binding protein [Bacillus cereus]